MLGAHMEQQPGPTAFHVQVAGEALASMAADLRAKLAAPAQQLLEKRDRLATLKARQAAEGATLQTSASHCAAQACACAT